MASVARRFRRHLPVYPFVLPTILLLLVFVYYPVFSAVYHSFFQWDGVNEKFIGLGNFVEMSQDERLIASAGNLAKLVLFSVTVPIVVPMLVAEVVFNLRSLRAQYFYRVLYVIPMVVPYIVIVLLWGFIYDPTVGLLNEVLKLFKLEGEAWLGSSSTVLYAIMGINFPWVSGFNLLIFLAGLYNIPPTIIDAARVDGATPIRRFFSIDLPLLVGPIKLLTVLAVINSIQQFQTILILTRGGPGYSSMVPGLHLFFNGFSFNRMGYASAIGLAMFVVIFIFTYINQRYVQATTEYEG